MYEIERVVGCYMADVYNRNSRSQVALSIESFLTPDSLQWFYSSSNSYKTVTSFISTKVKSPATLIGDRLYNLRGN